MISWVLLRDHQLVAIPQDDILGRAHGAFHYPVDIDHQAADRLCIAQLIHQLLADRECLVRRCRAAPELVAALLAIASSDRAAKIALQPIGQQVELVLFAFLQLFADEHSAFHEGEVGESARAVQDRGERFAAVNRILAGEPHFAAELDDAGLDPLRNRLDDRGRHRASAPRRRRHRPAEWPQDRSE